MVYLKYSLGRVGYTYIFYTTRVYICFYAVLTYNLYVAIVSVEL